MDSFYEQLREAQRIEQQRLMRERDYELYQAKRRRGDPDLQLRLQKIMEKYAHHLKSLRASYLALRSLGSKSRDIDCG